MQPVPTSVCSTAAACPIQTNSSGTRNGTAAVKVATYPSKDFTGTPETTTPQNIADWKPDMWGPEDKAPRSIRYTTAFKAAKAGKYLLLAAASGEDAYKVIIDGIAVLDQPRAEGQSPRFRSLDLEAGQTFERRGGVSAALARHPFRSWPGL